MSADLSERTWLRVPLLSIGLGLLAGAVEGLAIASTIQLQLSWVEAFQLMLCSLAAGALVALAVAIPTGLLAQGMFRMQSGAHRQAMGLGAVGFVLAAWYFWPMGLGLIQNGRWAGGLAGLAVPIGFFGTVMFNARHWLRKVEIGWEPRLGWLPISLIASLLLAAADATWLVRGIDQAEGIALEGDHNVLLITIDTLRRDHVSAYGEPEAVPTPRFDAFAEQGVLFTDAVTPLPETGPSHASMFTSLHPSTHGVISNGHDLLAGYTTIAERLSEEGYATGAFVSSFAVDSRTGLDQGFQIYDDDFMPAVHGISEIRLVGLLQRVIMRFGDPLKFPFLLERGADATNARAIPWLQARGDRPFLCWVHYFEPHAPYEIHPGAEAGLPDVDHRWILANEHEVDYTPELIEQLRALYGHEVSWVDARMGELLDALEGAGHADNTLVIITADHGEMLGEHDYHFNHHSIYDEAVRIPLAIRAPKLRAGTQVVDAQVRVMDIPPTVLDYLRLDKLDPTEGVDLLGYAEKVRHKSLPTSLVGRKTGALDRGALLGFRTGRPHEQEGRPLKYIWDLDEERELLFDLVGDPDELNDVSGEYPDLVGQARRVVTPDAERLRLERVEIDAATEEGLRALGYMD